MRSVLPIALLLALAAPLQAQERRDAEAPSIDAAAQIEQAEVRDGVPRAGATKVGIDANRIAQDERLADEAAVRQEPGSRNWWWIVLAVVVGGLIVVLLAR